MKSKTELRKEILALRDSLSARERIDKSRIITEKVIRHEKFQKADKVLLFASFRSEVDTTEIFEVAIAMGKEVYFPKVEGREMEFYRVEKEADLVEGHRGIREPLGEKPCAFSLNWMDEKDAFINKQRMGTELFMTGKPMHILVLMPGVVFDEEGNRIGYGGGYYDKFLQILEHHIKKENLYKLAIAYQCQIVEKSRIVSEPYDIKPNVVITEKTEYII